MLSSHWGYSSEQDRQAVFSWGLHWGSEVTVKSAERPTPGRPGVGANYQRGPATEGLEGEVTIDPRPQCQSGPCKDLGDGRGGVTGAEAPGAA